MTRKRKKKLVAETTNVRSEPAQKKAVVKARTKNQKRFLFSIYNNDLTFCVGPAGSGKTHLSVGAAVDLFNRKKIDKIILTRPMVEANQNQRRGKSQMGYLPGPIEQKMAPFLRPLYDELAKFMSPASIKAMLQAGTIEICPLAFIRGRTFENSYIVLDESQNATEEELITIATRLGIGSKLVIQGDPAQSDLEYHLQGGMENLMDDLDGLENLDIIELETLDIQRIKLVRDIVERLKELDEEASQPASLERVGYYERKDSPKPASANPSVERERNATQENLLDGRLRENLQG